MNRNIRRCIQQTMFLLALLVAVQSLQAAEGKQFYARLSRVIDGDSLLVDDGDGEIEVRLYGIDAPEFDQPYAEQAKYFLEKRTKQTRLLVSGLYRDKYGRLVAIVTEGQFSINQQLVAAGFAWVYPRYCRKKLCRQWREAENQARRYGRGLWRDDRPVAPWVWKRH